MLASAKKVSGSQKPIHQKFYLILRNLNQEADIEDQKATSKDFLFVYIL